MFLFILLFVVSSGHTYIENFRDTPQNAERGPICWVDRHWSVLITWLIRIFSLFLAVCIQQSATPTLTLTIFLTVTLQ